MKWVEALDTYIGSPDLATSDEEFGRVYRTVKYLIEHGYLVPTDTETREPVER